MNVGHKEERDMDKLVDMVGDDSFHKPLDAKEQAEEAERLSRRKARMEAALATLGALPSVGEAIIDEFAAKVAHQARLIARGYGVGAGVSMPGASWSDIQAVERRASELIEGPLLRTRVPEDLARALLDADDPGHAGADFPENGFAIKVELSGAESEGALPEAHMQVWMRDDWEFHEMMAQFALPASGAEEGVHEGNTIGAGEARVERATGEGVLGGASEEAPAPTTAQTGGPAKAEPEVGETVEKAAG